MRKALPIIAEDTWTSSSSGSNMNVMVARNHGSRCCICWPVGKLIRL